MKRTNGATAMEEKLKDLLWEEIRSISGDVWYRVDKAEPGQYVVLSGRQKPCNISWTELEQVCKSAMEPLTPTAVDDILG